MNDRASVTLTSLTVSYLIIATAAAILVAWITEDWTLFIPSMLLLGGVFATFVGLRQRTGALDRRRSNDGNFLMFWGTLLIAFGLIWAINYAYPGSMFLLVIGFLVWLGLAVLLFTIKKK
ncbi:MAG: hypothetical protein A4E30_00935 [Methanomassiliicoccales archaeon PtaB.Bin215]|nr:MAG: hypothetical protein A4E30_00935 [Methanomassiliicoccales archaeon PtaB.Bin215]